MKFPAVGPVGAERAHPLDAGLMRIRELSEFLRAELGRPPGGWLSLARLIEDRAILEDVLQRNVLAYEGSRRIAANFVAGGVAWAVSSAPLALMVIERRAIASEPDKMFLRIDARGGAQGAFYDDPSFCVLADDPAARHERADVVDEGSALHEWMRSRLVESLGPLVDVLSDLTDLGRRGLWGQVASSWGRAILWTAQLAGRDAAGMKEAQAFLSDPRPPFSYPPTFYRLRHRGDELVAMRRGVCCLAYKLSDYPYCGSCPLISEEERRLRLSDEAGGQA